MLIMEENKNHFGFRNKESRWPIIIKANLWLLHERTQEEKGQPPEVKEKR